MILPHLFRDLEEELGAFTLDACANNDGRNALCDDYCSPNNSFLAKDCAGHQVWMNPPFHYKTAKAFLKHYLKCKATAPSTTSACIMLPEHSANNMKDLLQTFQVIRRYPKLQATVSVPTHDGSRTVLPKGLPFDILVYYDPPQSDTHTDMKDEETPNDKLVFQVPCILAHALHGFTQGSKVVAGFDTLANRNFIDQRLLAKLGIKTKQRPKWDKCVVKLGDNTVANTLGLAKITLGIQGFNASLWCEVLEQLPDGFDVILGQAFLAKHKAILNMEARTVLLRTPRRKFVVNCRDMELQDSSEGTPTPTHVPLLTALQLKRVVRKHHMVDWEHTYLAFVTKQDMAKVTVMDTEDPDVKGILEERSKLFEEIPHGLLHHGDQDIEHPIDLNSKETPNIRYGRHTVKERELIQKTLEELTEKGHITPSNSPFGAPILFVGKKDGTMRMCMDYRALNKITIKNRYPLPRINDLLDMLNGAQFFTSLDLQSGYHQIRIRPEDCHKTAFNTPFGHYEWRVMPFGLCNAPPTFQRAMNSLFGKRVGQYVLVYMDDILIYSKTREEHLKHLREVLALLEEHNYYCKRSKCHFLKTEVKFLGHVISKQGIKVDPDKTKVVKDWRRPETKEEVRSLLGFGNYFRRFIYRYSEMVLPLTEMTKKDVPALWSEQAHKAFENLKNAIVNAPVLKHPELDKPFKLICDASDFACGAILAQEDEQGATHPCAFSSYKLNKAERNYSTEDRELLAVIKGLKLFRCYLEGTEFTVVTDHNPLKYFDTKKDLSPRQARWATYMARFDYEWEWIKGITNPADFLSRNPVYSPMLAVMTRAQAKKDRVEEFTETITESKATRSRRTKEDGSKKKSPHSKRKKRYNAFQKEPPIEWLERSPDVDQPVQHQDQLFDLDTLRRGYDKDKWFTDERYAGERKDLEEKHGLWYKGKTIAVPKYLRLRTWIMQEFHDTPWAGHMGLAKTLQNIKRVYWWKGMKQDVQEYIKHSDSCQRCKGGHDKVAGLLKPLPIPAKAWESISVDFITDLPMTLDGYDSVMVVVDRLTKMTHFVPTRKDATALDCAKLFRREIFRIHGCPKSIVSDRDPKFVSGLWTDFCKLIGATRAMSTAFHPQTDGQTERMNRFLEEILRHYVSPHQKDWVDYLDTAEFAINNADQESTGYSPFFLNYGYHPASPASLVDTPKASNGHTDEEGHEAYQSRVAILESMFETLRATVEHAKANIQAAQQRQKHYYDGKRQERQYDEGTTVLLSTKNIGLSKVGCRKLLPKFIGPFRILKRIGDVAYRLELPASLKIHNVFHVSCLKPYYDDGRVQPPPLPIVIDGELEYEVEMVYGHRDVKRGKGLCREYLVRWKGYGNEHDEWLPLANFGDSTECIQEYWERHGVRQ